MDPHSSNARNANYIEIEDAEVHAVLDAAEHLMNPTSENPVILDAQTNERLYIHEVASSCVPVIGMEFSSIEQAYVFLSDICQEGRVLCAKRRYNMVCVPFTGIDNHCRNVMLGAGLLASESIESYKWLLQSFLDSFGKQPKVVVTDQDPAMKQAIEAVFDKSRHGLCMWHIMKKVADKVGYKLSNNEDFKRRMCDIVWIDLIAPETLEREWKLIMIEYGLTENKCIDDMFGMRSSWIPAFYRHEPMSGLMRTISRSESENHFFCQVANSQLTLVEFF
ncbi:protein FAR1-RELATED SEQUENCE 4-like [Helianthus annuus]|uniref:protein FAR1-RELATED SEQUENCE 4-like n=1 Tax=Helianthus annuus TaxID=4232 RepID=UPI000B8FBDD5|nr:protein FAR1-RELATED SEQUENCE 4-like [Helianthus annuus]